MTSVRSPPSPRCPVSATRSALVGCVARGSAAGARRRGGRRRASRRRRAGLRRQTAIARRILGAVPDAADGLTPNRAARVAHRGGRCSSRRRRAPARRTALVERFARSSADGAAPGGDPRRSPAEAAADALRALLEDALDGALRGARGPHRPRASARACCATRRSRPGSTPSSPPVTPADRLAMLLERVDELPLRRHDLARQPGARCSARSSPGSTASRRSWSPPRDYAALGGRRSRTMPTRAPRASASSPSSTPTHDRLLRRAGRARLRRAGPARPRCCATRPHVRARVARALPPRARRRRSRTELRPALVLAAAGARARRASPPPATTTRRSAALRGAGAQEPARLPPPSGPDVTVVRLRAVAAAAPRAVLAAARAVVDADRRTAIAAGADRARGAGGEVRFWRCATSARRRRRAPRRSSGWSREGARPRTIGVLVRSVRNEGQAVAVALEERAVPYRLAGAAAFFQRAEVRDVLAWLRLLVDPGDAGAVVRALARPPIELRAVDLARCVQIARRRKLDMVGALVAATESPQIPPEARERILAFLKLHRAAAARARHDAPRPLRPPAHRPPRAAPPAALRRPGRRRRAARQPGARSASWPPPTCAARRRPPRASSPATLAAVADAGLQRGGGGAGEAGPRGVQRDGRCTRRKGLEFDHVFVLGLQAARMPGPRRRRSSRSPTRCSRRRCRPTPRPRTSPRCGGCCTSR